MITLSQISTQNNQKQHDEEDDDYPTCYSCGARATKAKCYVSGVEYCYLDEDGYCDEVYDSETTDTNDTEYYCDDCI